MTNDVTQVPDSAVTGLERFSLQGRRALVTGASRGIGAALAVAFAGAGADVALCARSAMALEAVAGTIREMGRRALAIPCDVVRSQEVAAAVERAWAELGPIDVLVNNAGGPLFQAPFLEVREEGWNRILDLNLTSVFRFSQQVGGRMVERQSGSIVNVASVLPTRVWPAIAGYSAAKAGVLSLTQTLAVEWGGAGVRVNALCPGWIRTGLNRAYTDDRARAATAIDAVPLARWGEPDDLIGPAIWLASNASRYVTGAIIPIDGGLAVGQPEQWRQAMRLVGRNADHGAPDWGPD
ncbi:MAG: SDR family NAD(P)-dependent oxidoreductase [Chloroflexota bacterium]